MDADEKIKALLGLLGAGAKNKVLEALENRTPTWTEIEVRTLGCVLIERFTGGAIPPVLIHDVVTATMAERPQVGRLGHCRIYGGEVCGGEGVVTRSDGKGALPGAIHEADTEEIRRPAEPPRSLAEDNARRGAPVDPPGVIAAAGDFDIDTGVPAKCTKCGHVGYVLIDPSPALIGWVNRVVGGVLGRMRRIAALVRAGEPVPLALVNDPPGEEDAP